jgi:hypothetical protein
LNLPAAQVAHLALPCPQINPSAKPKEPLFPYAPKTVQTKQIRFVEHLLKIIFIKSLEIKKLYLLL